MFIKVSQQSQNLARALNEIKESMQVILNSNLFNSHGPAVYRPVDTPLPLSWYESGGISKQDLEQTIVLINESLRFQRGSLNILTELERYYTTIRPDKHVRKHIETCIRYHVLTSTFGKDIKNPFCQCTLLWAQYDRLMEIMPTLQVSFESKDFDVVYRDSKTMKVDTLMLSGSDLSINTSRFKGGFPARALITDYRLFPYAAYIKKGLVQIHLPSLYEVVGPAAYEKLFPLRQDALEIPAFIAPKHVPAKKVKKKPTRKATKRL